MLTQPSSLQIKHFVSPHLRYVHPGLHTTPPPGVGLGRSAKAEKLMQSKKLDAITLNFFNILISFYCIHTFKLMQFQIAMRHYQLAPAFSMMTLRYIATQDTRSSRLHSWDLQKENLST